MKYRNKLCAEYEIYLTIITKAQDLVCLYKNCTYIPFTKYNDVEISDTSNTSYAFISINK